MERKELLRRGLISVLPIVVVALILLILIVPAPTVVIYILVASAIILTVLIRWHARRTTYVCPACGRDFQISSLTDAIHPHTMRAKLLRCPLCGVTNWCPYK